MLQGMLSRQVCSDYEILEKLKCFEPNCGSEEFLDISGNCVSTCEENYYESASELKCLLMPSCSSGEIFDEESEKCTVDQSASQDLEDLIEGVGNLTNQTDNNFNQTDDKPSDSSSGASQNETEGSSGDFGNS